MSDPATVSRPRRQARCSPTPGRRWLIAVFLVAVLARAGFGTLRLVKADDPRALEFPDEKQYWEMAEAFQAGRGLPDELGFQATRMPLFPVALSFLAPFEHGRILAKVALWVVGGLGAVFIAGAAGTLCGSRVGVIAGLMVAFDPFLIFFSSLLLTETPFVTAEAGLWWLLASVVVAGSGSLFRWAAIGLAAALCVYIREASLGLVLAAMAFPALQRSFRRRNVLGAVCAAGLVAAALVPWAARNQRVIGEWTWLTTRGGISLYDAVGPQATGASDLGSVKQMPAVLGKSEVAWNRYFLRESLVSMREDPGRMMRLATVKLARMWNPFPNVESHQSRLTRLVSAAWTLPTFALALVGALLVAWTPMWGGWRTALFLLLPALYFSGLHSVFVGSVRYRLGATPMLAILAAAAIVSGVSRLRSRIDSRECRHAD